MSHKEPVDEQLTAELRRICGDAGFLKLVEQFGGRRLFIARSLDGRPPVMLAAVSAEVALKLGQAYGGTYLRVPLARSVRARHYRHVLGLSNGEIASRLGITETGVDKIFAAMPQKPAKGAGQLPLPL